MQKTDAAERTGTGNAPRQPDPKREELSPADQRDLDAFESVSRMSRRGVAETIQKLVRPA